MLHTHRPSSLRYFLRHTWISRVPLLRRIACWPLEDCTPGRSQRRCAVPAPRPSTHARPAEERLEPRVITNNCSPATALLDVAPLAGGALVASLSTPTDDGASPATAPDGSDRLPPWLSLYGDSELEALLPLLSQQAQLASASSSAGQDLVFQTSLAADSIGAFAGSSDDQPGAWPQDDPTRAGSNSTASRRAAAGPGSTSPDSSTSSSAAGSGGSSSALATANIQATLPTGSGLSSPGASGAAGTGAGGGSG